MLLKELFDTERTDGREIAKHAGDEIGYGYYSKVYDKVDDQHMVVKQPQPFTSWITDGFWMYASYIVENKLATKNPHFPRIYKFDPEERVCEMERLIPYTRIDDDILRAYIMNVTGGDVAEISDNFDKSDLQDGFTEKLHGMVEAGGGFERLKRGTLAKALKVVSEIGVKYDLIVDIHRDNVMYRRTGIGIEAVITDPFSGKKDRSAEEGV